VEQAIVNQILNKLVFSLKAFSDIGELQKHILKECEKALQRDILISGTDFFDFSRDDHLREHFCKLGDRLDFM
jgi:hypothetical protein